MSDVRRLPIDVDEVANAMDVRERDTIEFYLDTQTGEIVVTGDGVDDEVAEQVEADEDRYVNIPEVETAESYEWMREFIDSLEDRGVAGHLSRAITGAGAFGRFKRELSNRPAVQAQWYKFHNDALRRQAIDWLRSLNLESTL
jgi:hypothetical protein